MDSDLKMSKTRQPSAVNAFTISEGQRTTTDKNDPFFEYGVQTREKWVDGAKSNIGFGRVTENTQYRFSPRTSCTEGSFPE